MKLKIFDENSTEKGTKDLPKIFSEEYRPDLIKRAVQSIQSINRQPYGADPMAGKKCSAELSRRRRKYRGSYGHGISRVPRKIHSRNGTRFNWTGAFAPGTVGGRRAHAPKASKILERKINIKERRKAIRSAIAATIQKQIVQEKGHAIPDTYPFILSDSFESFSKTKQVKDALSKIGFGAELDRSSEKTIRAGKSRLRGRKYRKRKGVLLVVSDKCSLLKSGLNIPGIDVCTINMLNAELLAPGAVGGRATLFTQSAVDKLEKENLFYDNTTTLKPKKAEAKVTKTSKPKATKK